MCWELVDLHLRVVTVMIVRGSRSRPLALHSACLDSSVSRRIFRLLAHLQTIFSLVNSNILPLLRFHSSPVPPELCSQGDNWIRTGLPHPDTTPALRTGPGSSYSHSPIGSHPRTRHQQQTSFTLHLQFPGFTYHLPSFPSRAAAGSRPGQARSLQAGRQGVSSP